MKIELVKMNTNTGAFAIRKLTLFGYEYLDLGAIAVDFWWSRGSPYFDSCLGGEEKVRDIYKKYNKKERRLNMKRIANMERIIVLGRKRA